jgi:hypothetical protein
MRQAWRNLSEHTVKYTQARVCFHAQQPNPKISREGTNVATVSGSTDKLHEAS